MKTMTLIAAILLGSALIGCGDSKQPEAGTTGSAPSKPSADIAKGASLGSEQAGEHYSITLTAEPAELKVGKATFSAKVLHHGSPTENAAVKLSLSMPKMDMGGPTVDLKHTGGGVYEGEADLSMGGDWQAKVSVDQEGHTGEAVYDFVVMQ